MWTCGGEVLIATCSHVGHVFRKSTPYSFPGGTSKVVNRNNARLAAVWLDEWSDFYFSLNPGVEKPAAPISIETSMWFSRIFYFLHAPIFFSACLDSAHCFPYFFSMIMFPCSSAPPTPVTCHLTSSSSRYTHMFITSSPRFYCTTSPSTAHQTVLFGQRNIKENSFIFFSFASHLDRDPRRGHSGSKLWINFLRHPFHFRQFLFHFLPVSGTKKTFCTYTFLQSC